MPDDVKTAAKAAKNEKFGLDADPADAMRRGFESWARGMSKFSHDFAQFMQARLLEESTMWEKLATCRDPADALELQTKFATKASTDYAEAAQKFSRLMLDIASSYGADLRREPRDTD